MGSSMREYKRPGARANRSPFDTPHVGAPGSPPGTSDHLSTDDRGVLADQTAGFNFGQIRVRSGSGSPTASSETASRVRASPIPDAGRSATPSTGERLTITTSPTIRVSRSPADTGGAAVADPKGTDNANAAGKTPENRIRIHSLEGLRLLPQTQHDIEEHVEWGDTEIDFWVKDGDAVVYYTYLPEGSSEGGPATDWLDLAASIAAMTSDPGAFAENKGESGTAGLPGAKGSINSSWLQGLYVALTALTLGAGKVLGKIAGAAKGGFRWLRSKVGKMFDWVADRLPFLRGSGTRRLLSAFPQLTPGEGRDMLREALGHLKAAPPNTRIEMFDDFSEQIMHATKARWSAQKHVVADGGAIYLGELGEALVIGPTGQIYRGHISRMGTQFDAQGGKLVPIYEGLAEIK
jgi:hypothetical protein